jgi:hypothetical protein
MGRVLLTLLVVIILSRTLSADFIPGEPNDAYHTGAFLYRGLFDPLPSLQVQPTGRVTLDATMTKLTFEDLAFSFRGTYTESYEVTRPDPFTPPQISAVHQMENPPYTLRVTEPLVFDVQYQWPRTPVWMVTSAYDTRDDAGTPHPELLTMIEVDSDIPKPDQITAQLEPVKRDGIIVDYEATLIFGYNLGPEYNRFSLQAKMTSSIPAPGILAGDASRDGRFNSQDLVQLFQEGRYEQGSLLRPPSISLDDTVMVAGRKVSNFYDYNLYVTQRWSWGDFNDDLAFDSSDLVLALQTGRYEQQSAAIHEVPEPSMTIAMVLVCFCADLACRCKKPFWK